MQIPIVSPSRPRVNIYCHSQHFFVQIRGQVSVPVCVYVCTCMLVRMKYGIFGPHFLDLFQCMWQILQATFSSRMCQAGFELLDPEAGGLPQVRG